MAKSISQENQAEAMKMAKATQKPSQTKEQTKLIAQGIEKGIAEYKKLQKAKARGADKQRKQNLKAKNQLNHDVVEQQQPPQSQKSYLPWVLLIASWVGFIASHVLQAN
ncbi:DUF2956 domain-containing protein [Shewanella sp. 10N.286.48.A6]|uniref:DUF2956 domain-containing protein n=1 Tax=Shewanella sp. 10N.286.48.A6 TaxID=1880833 RepID=UPI000C81B324|nr:DUF2956 domain-containing protein [Shewanella sp. 10N.286.48.A6]PMI02522.1 hypothetical protein BCU55_06495 [Shewanella sp. 10N.286.48.A6]